MAVRELSNSPRKSADRRKAILIAAAHRFAEFGFEATTVRQIADDVNILSGSLYHHFATKEQMLAEVVHDAVIDQRHRALELAGSCMNADGKLAIMIRTELSALAEQIEAYAIIFNERKLFRRNPDFHHLITARKDTFEAWRSVLAQGVSEGAFREGSDSYLTVSTIMRMLNTGADWYRHEDGSPIDAMSSYSLEELTDFLTAFVIRSVRTAELAGAPIPHGEPPA